MGEGLYKASVELSHLQRGIYTYLKNKAKSFEGQVSNEFSRYRKDHERHGKSEFKICNFNTLLKAIDKSNIIYLGDFHTFDQSSRNLQRLLRVLIKDNDSYILGVEFVHKKHQKYIDSYLEGHITEIEFLESIQYHESWRFPWSYYRHFFVLAKKMQMKIVALNSDGGLKKRDMVAASILKELYEENEDKKILVLFGEYHIVPSKLPGIVKKSIHNKKFKQTIIHQNLDEVYWRLVDKKGGTDRIVAFGPHEYVLQTSPPWIKYESMIYWYEHLSEDPDFDIHESVLEQEGAFTFNSNTVDNFAYITSQINQNLKLGLSSYEIEDFNLYDHQNLDFIHDKLEHLKTKSLTNFYVKLIKCGRSFKIPDTKNYYCPSYSINRLAFLAGIHLYLQLLQKKKDGANEYDYLIRTKTHTKFIFFCYQSFMGYFSSKLINPYRKCDRYQDLLKQLRNSKTKVSDKKILRLCLDVMKAKTPLESIFEKASDLDAFMVARKLGYLLGDIYFEEAYTKKSKGSKEVLKAIMNFDFEEKAFKNILKALLPRETYRTTKKNLF